MLTIPEGSFLILRHGETAANAADIICGSTDLPLAPSGRAQAEAAAAFLRDLPLRRIVTSPLTRAVQTAEAVARVTGLVPQRAEGLAERNWGAWEGQPRAMLRREETPPGGESPAAFRDRIRRAFAALDLAPLTLIVAHSGTDREIHALLTDAPHQRMSNAEIRLWQPAPQGWRCHAVFKLQR